MRRETLRLHWLKEAVALCRPDVCIPWPFPLSGLAPLLYVDFSLAYAHRVAYAMKYSPLPPEERLYQQCDTLYCMNPYHYDVVRSKPVHKASRKRSPVSDECPHGHKRTPKHTYVTPRGVKVCRICQGAAYRRFIARKKGVSHG